MRVDTNQQNTFLCEEVARLFKMFGDPTRVHLLMALAQQEVCVGDLVAITGVSQSAISHQLRLLRQARLVRSRRQGTTIFYALADDHVATILDQGLEHAQEKK
jgi:ArsR family transcriptional regulator